MSKKAEMTQLLPLFPVSNLRSPLFKAFTLVEILVVIGVLSLLVALVFPAVQSAVARAESARCLGQLKSLGVSLSSYLADHEMILPVMAAARSSKAEDVPALDTVLLAYAGDARVFVCPSDREIAARTGTSYFYNSALGGQSLAALNFLGISDAPTRIPVLVDKEGWHKHSASRVNHLFADGHAGSQLRLFAE